MKQTDSLLVIVLWRSTNCLTFCGDAFCFGLIYAIIAPPELQNLNKGTNCSILVVGLITISSAFLKIALNFFI